MSDRKYAKVVIPHKDQPLYPGQGKYGVFLPSGESLPHVLDISIQPNIDGFTEVTVKMLAEIETAE